MLTQKELQELYDFWKINKLGDLHPDGYYAPETPVQYMNIVDRIRELHQKIWSNHNQYKELDEKINNLPDGEEKDKLKQR